MRLERVKPLRQKYFQVDAFDCPAGKEDDNGSRGRSQSMDESLMDRFWEVDTLRGMAILLMVLYHLAFDLDYFGVLSIDMASGVLFYIARITVTLFLLLVGLSLHLSFSRAGKLGSQDLFAARLIKRSLRILALALCITLVTYLLIGRGYIIFGALHLIGLSLLLAYPFLCLGWVNFLIGSILIILGLYLWGINAEGTWLLWLGLSPADFYSLDYVPLLPWFGVVLYGVGLGGLLYPGYGRRISLPDQYITSESPLIRLLCLLGRNSLAIYLVHQPLIMILLILARVPLRGIL